jgi:MoaA/NifB/PqqE/SkfB family radical SAM enzyme
MDLSEQAELALPPRAQLEPVGPAKAPALMGFRAFRLFLAEQPGLKEVELAGAGEALAHPRLFDMVSYAAARGIAVSTTTSFLTISDARIAACVASGLRRLDVVPGAAHPSDCDYLRPGSKLRRALRNVRRLANARQRHPEIRIVLMLLRNNLPQLPELARLAKEHGADALVLRHLWHDVCPARRFVEAQSLLGVTVDLTELQRSAAELGIALELPRVRRCERPWRSVHIGASGEALPCPMARTEQRPTVGNVRRDGVVRVWNGAAYRDFRERLAAGAPPELCRRCSTYQAGLASNSLASRSV